MVVYSCGKHVYASSNFNCALWLCAVVHIYVYSVLAVLVHM